MSDQRERSRTSIAGVSCVARPCLPPRWAFPLFPRSRSSHNRNPSPNPRKRKKKPRSPQDPFGEAEKPKDGKLIDKEGREYRVCPQCAYNMYKQGRMWVCENCGYCYVE